MNNDDARSHSFVVKVWIEERASAVHGARWRGHITHVPDGERHYMEDLEVCSKFIGGYLAAMGVRFGVASRLRQWLTHFGPGR